jgi:2-polyprenyl-3-methyl-5-hydroxy-6-metoxy-1,4-benzoquinol methylase
MPFPASLRERHRQPEIMDQPGLEARRHFHALEGLANLNCWSGSARILWPPLRAEARQVGLRPLRVLDIATGGGDIPISLWRKAQRAGVSLEIEGSDVSAQAAAYAQQRADSAMVGVRFFQLDVLKDTIPAGYDVLLCSLFLHHLDEAEAVHVLRRLGEAAGRLVLINDLVRNYANFVLVSLAAHLLTTSKMVHVDGPRSVQAAFTVEEMRTLAREAGLAGASVERRYPCRMLLTWRRP